jgi:Fic family protein
MFNPKYTISLRLLENIKRISTLVFELNHKRFPKVILMDMLRRAHEVSAHASTSIEGNPLPLTDVRVLLKTTPKKIRDTEREVLNYNQALVWLEKETKKNTLEFNLDLILTIHRTVVDGLMPSFQVGKIRNDAVFVNDPLARKTVYWPPDHQDLAQLLKEMFDYIQKNRATMDPLLLAGIFHKQFVIIHPFMDGNGRSVRLATKVLLSAMGLNTFNLFSFENYYNQNVTKYFQHVGSRGNYYDIHDQIDFTEWLEYFTDGIIDELLRVSKVLQEKSISPETVLQPHHEIILRYIKKEGHITDKIYSTLTDRAKPTRNLDFNKLIDMGLIEAAGKGKATIYKLRS